MCGMDTAEGKDCIKQLRNDAVLLQAWGEAGAIAHLSRAGFPFASIPDAPLP
jgi:hypothetical protein